MEWMKTGYLLVIVIMVIQSKLRSQYIDVSDNNASNESQINQKISENFRNFENINILPVDVLASVPI